MSHRCADWRAIGAGEAVALVASEARAWAAELDWDVTTAWQALEPARASGTLPGFVSRDRSGQISGWCCCLTHQGTLHVPMIVAETPEATSALVAAVAASAGADQPLSVAFCARDAAAGLGDVLAARGFDVTTYRYLSAAPRNGGEDVAGVRPWRTDDTPAMARLFARAYAGQSGVRAFAVHGLAEEWFDYTDSLVLRPGCGQFLPAASFVLDVPAMPSRLGVALIAPMARAGADLDGAVITTRIAGTVAHIAQVAIDPVARGLGLGRALMLTAMSAVAQAGFTQLTLLVDAHNVAATRMYADLGFQDRAAFVVGVARQPRRSNRVALATGGASTRR